MDVQEEPAESDSPEPESSEESEPPLDIDAADMSEEEKNQLLDYQESKRLENIKVASHATPTRHVTQKGLQKQHKDLCRPMCCLQRIESCKCFPLEMQTHCAAHGLLAEFIKCIKRQGI